MLYKKTNGLTDSLTLTLRRQNILNFLLSSANMVNSECRQQQLSDGVCCPRARVSVYAWVQGLISVIPPTKSALIYMQRVTENTGDDRHCWRLPCGVERQGVLLPEDGFLPLTSSLEMSGFMWCTLGSERGSWSTHSSRLSARVRARETQWPGLLDWGILHIVSTHQWVWICLKRL